ncbi:MAG: helicase-associated domain-containing protein [Clostridiales Family XIII bacterium]|nr:helicase-associated domain-containing protein [Clostridiales Family XIII bacterium]
MGKDRLDYALDGLTVTELDELGRIAAVRASGKKKQEKIQLLKEYYASPGCVERIYNGLNTCEKAIITCMAQSNFNASADELDSIYKKYNAKSRQSDFFRYYSRGCESYFDRYSRAKLLIAGSDFPPVIREELMRIIPPLPVEFDEMPEEEMLSGTFVLMGREQRISDFETALRFINSNNASATKASGMISKSSLKKLYGFVGYDEVFLGDSGSIDGIGTAKDTLVGESLIELMLNAKVLAIQDGKFALGKNAKNFALMGNPEQIKFLYDAYLTHDNSVIHEAERNAAQKYKYRAKHFSYAHALSLLAKYLRKCPVGPWIDMQSFRTVFRKKEGGEITNALGDILIRDDYCNEYYTPANFQNFETHVIDTALFAYFAVLGALDAAASEGWSDYETRRYYSVDGFRITKLGAWLLGIAGEYEHSAKTPGVNNASQLIVQPNFEIIIPAGPAKLAHELYFDRFLDRKSADEQVAVFSLDFKGMAKALDGGMKIEEIKAYLEGASTESVPENIIRALDEWIAQSKRIRIKTITVIEADDPYLFEEIKNFKGIRAIMKNEIKTGIEIDKNDINKAKKEIEKNRRFAAFEIS